MIEEYKLKDDIIAKNKNSTHRMDFAFCTNRLQKKRNEDIAPNKAPVGRLAADSGIEIIKLLKT